MNEDMPPSPCEPTGLACDLEGIPVEKRDRYVELVGLVLSSIEEKRELPDGFAFRIAGDQITGNQLVEWIGLEKQCCPFFGFQIAWEPDNGPLWLRLTGRPGVKEFIMDELGVC
jgi:hypothetical protein